MSIDKNNNKKQTDNNKNNRQQKTTTITNPPSTYLPYTYAPLAMDGKATVERFLFSARVRQFFTVFSKLGTASLSDHWGLCT